MSCLIDFDIDDLYETLKHCVDTARKDFICCECGCTIPKGERYSLFVGELFEKIDVHRTCMVCENISDKILCTRPFSGMYEEISNSIDDDINLYNCILMVLNKEEFEKMCAMVLSFENYDENYYDKEIQ